LLFSVLFISAVVCDVCPNTGLDAIDSSFDFLLCSQFQSNACCRTASESDINDAYSATVGSSGLCNYASPNVRPNLVNYYCIGCDPNLNNYLGSWPDWHNISGKNNFFFGTPDSSKLLPVVFESNTCSFTPGGSVASNNCTIATTTSVYWQNCNQDGCMESTCVNTTTTNSTCYTNGTCRTDIPQSSSNCTSFVRNQSPFVDVQVVYTYFFCDEFVDIVMNFKSDSNNAWTSDYDTCGIRSPTQGIVYPSTYVSGETWDRNQIVADFAPAYLGSVAQNGDQAGLMSIKSTIPNGQNIILNSNWSDWSSSNAFYYDSYGHNLPTYFSNLNFSATYSNTCYNPSSSFATSGLAQFSALLLLAALLISILF